MYVTLNFHFEDSQSVESRIKTKMGGSKQVYLGIYLTQLPSKLPISSYFWTNTFFSPKFLKITTAGALELAKAMLAFEQSLGLKISQGDKIRRPSPDFVTL
jgi:hypothetical protein